MCENKQKGKTCHFPKNKLENNLLKACLSHFFLLYLHP